MCERVCGRVNGQALVQLGLLQCLHGFRAQDLGLWSWVEDLGL